MRRLLWGLPALATLLIAGYHVDQLGRGDAPFVLFVAASVAFFLKWLWNMRQP